MTIFVNTFLNLLCNSIFGYCLGFGVAVASFGTALSLINFKGGFRR